MGKYLKLTSILMLSLLFVVGCSSDTTTDEKIDKEEKTTSEVKVDKEVKEEKVEVEKPKANETAEEAYQRILDDYSVKIKEATPGLVIEYKEEAKSNSNGIEGLAELSNKKITKLAEINADGVTEMAEVMLGKGTGSYSDYEAWAIKLMNVYTEEATKITDAYMESAM